MHLPDCVCRVFGSLKLSFSCEVVEKSGFGPRFARGGDSPDFGHAFSNRTHFRACDRFSFSSIQRARGVGGEKRKQKNRGKT